MAEKLKANVPANGVTKVSDVNSKIRDVNPPVTERVSRKFPIGSLDMVVGGETIDGWAWNEQLPSRPVQVTLHIDNQVVALITPQNYRADLGAAGIAHGCFAFSWPVPVKYRDGQQHEVRAYIADFQEEIPNSPIRFTLTASAAEVGSAKDPLFLNPQFDLWPAGLSGAYNGKNTEIAPGLIISSDEDEADGKFFVASPQFSSIAIAPHYGVRIVSEGGGPVWLYHRLSERAKRPFSTGVTLSQEISLANATEPTYQRTVVISLVHQTKDGYKRLRRVVRGRTFRRPTLLTFFLKLTAEEQSFLAARTLFLGTSVENAKVFQVYAPQVVRPYAAPSVGLIGFEDNRLSEAFKACGELAAAHNNIAEYSRILSVAVPTVSASLLGSETESERITPGNNLLAHMRYPFTQIIIPAYNGDSIVLDCLRSVQANTHTPFQCLVINDGSRRHTADMLAAFVASDPRFIMFDREANRGYTKSVNEAIKLSGADWVVVLNSDTLVSRDWLARLHDAAASDPKVGMAGPLSNAASYQSLPELRNSDGSWSKNDFIKPSDTERVQRLLESLSLRSYPMVPLLNGFCTLISQKVFDEIGLLDEDAFPIGYGEETDLCIRAGKAGFKLVIADDCFVYHRKSVTFGGKGRKVLSQAGNNELLNKHVGIIMPELEQMMQGNPVLARIREQMVTLKSEIG